MNRLPLWMAVFAMSLLLSMIFSRFYCGFICPINTVMKPITYLKRKLKIKSLSPPKILMKSYTRYVALLTVTVILVLSIITNREMPVLPLLLGLGFFITLFFGEALFHRHLCPYGALLKHSAKSSRKAVTIDEDACINCGKCQKVCPTEAISKHETFHRIDKQACLTCFNCAHACPVNVIRYK